MRTRIISGIVLLPLLFVIFLGGHYLAAGWLIIAILGIKEFFNGFKAVKVKPCYWIGYISAGLLFIMSFIKPGTEYYLAWIFGVIVASFAYLFRIDERELDDGLISIVGMLYIVFFPYHIVLIDQTGSAELIWLVLFTAFGTDIMAYFSGFLFGKHKLCPKISPKKTVEGAIGGIVGSMILCTLFGYLFAGKYLIDCLLIGFFGSIFAQFGDLTASIFKRKIGIKDFSNLIPGHGGILDRFDSVLLTAPFVYYYIIIVI